MLFLAVVLLVLALSPWTLFPFVVAVLPRRRGETHRDLTPTLVSVCIPAHNEAAVIRAKLDNTLASARGNWQREILVCDDGSTDGTADIVAAYADFGVRLVRHTDCQGKPGALASLVAAARGDVVVLSDASAIVADDTITRLVDAVCRKGVGVATARYVLRAAAGAGAERGSFLIDALLRGLASSRGILVGASGAAMALRRMYADPLPADTIHDDYQLAVRARAAGAAVVWVGDAVVFDTTADTDTTRRRYRRMAMGNLQVLVRARVGLPSSTTWRDRLAVLLPVLLHKTPKAFAPLLLLLAAAAATAAAPQLMLVAALVVGVPVLALMPDTVVHVARIGLSLSQGIVAFGRGAMDVRWRLHHTEAAAPAPVPTSLPAIPRAVAVGKRVFDVVTAGLGLLAMSPVLAVLAALIKLDSRGPVLYRQERLRFDDEGRPRPFAMFKLRTMRTDAEADGNARWAQKNDPRVTRIGRFLRRSRLDEVPQLVNVLRGEMTVVGPRPERPSFVEQLRTVLPAYDERLRRVKPGITGWAQIHCAYDEGIDSVKDKVLYDLAYVAHLYRFRSWVRIEALTVMQTFGVMVSGRGAR